MAMRKAKISRFPLTLVLVEACAQALNHASSVRPPRRSASNAMQHLRIFEGCAGRRRGGVLLLRIFTSKIPEKLPRITEKVLALSGTPHCTEP